MVFISVIIWVIYTTIAIAIFDLDKRDPVTNKVILPKTKKEYTKVGTGILSICVLTMFLIIMHDYHEDLLGQIYTYIGSVILVIYGIAIVCFGANPWKK